jgi:uncharacterized integral membrane protein (TIGR00697 family)
VDEQRFSHRFVTVVAIFVTCLITANITAVKLLDIGGIVMDAGTLIFPVSYIFGDVLTEVYGFRTARRVIWLGFLCNLLTVAAISLSGALPAAEFWNGQQEFERILGYAPRILAASFCAYLVGELANSMVLARLKVATNGRFLWLRTISSTVVGQGLDSLVFVTLAFAFTVPAGAILGIILTQWVIKSVYEAAATPFTYFVVNRLKRTEGVDVYDRDTSFNPLPTGR